MPFFFYGGKMKYNKGFTLVEMIVVIVILGILAVTALPKFINLGKDAKVMVLQQISVSVKSANDLMKVKSKLPSYSLIPHATRTDLVDVDLNNNGVIDDGDIRLINNYIDNTNISKLIEIDDEFVFTEDNPEFTYIGYDIDGSGSVVNDQCYFRYTQALSATAPPVYQLVTDGC